MSACEHNTTIELFQHNEISFGTCTWGCGELLVSILGDNGITKTFSISELSALQKRVEELEKISFAFYDVLDGNAESHELQDRTVLPLERCEEISALFFTENESKREWRNS